MMTTRTPIPVSRVWTVRADQIQLGDVVVTDSPIPGIDVTVAVVDDLRLIGDDVEIRGRGETNRDVFLTTSRGNWMTVVRMERT